MLGLERFRLLDLLGGASFGVLARLPGADRKCDSCKRCEGWIGLKASWAEIVGLRIGKGGRGRTERF
jgi:hypothetical protein